MVQKDWIKIKSVNSKKRILKGYNRQYWQRYDTFADIREGSAYWFNSIAATEIGFSESQKLWRNLSSSKSLMPTHNLVR